MMRAEMMIAGQSVTGDVTLERGLFSGARSLRHDTLLNGIIDGRLPFTNGGMTQETLADLLDSITYKPGFLIRVDRGALAISWRAPDATKRLPYLHEPIQLNIAVVISSYDLLSDTTFLQLVRRTIEKLEQHEIDEFLQVNGAPIRNPHPV